MRNSLPVVLITFLAQSIFPNPLSGGSYLNASASEPDAVTHAPHYTGSGQTILINVCTSSESFAPSAEVALSAALDTWNSLEQTTSNLHLGEDNNIPAGYFDLESLFLHEIGHCIGLHHPNHGVRDPIEVTDFTRADPGPDGNFSFDPGSDGIPGSPDDRRDDDISLVWHFRGSNNPFDPVSSIDQTNYVVGSIELGCADCFTANGSRDVASSEDFGLANTEVVMQNQQFEDEAQRTLTADDIAMVRYAMTGLDELAGTSDDYSFLLVLNDPLSDCDIRVEFVGKEVLGVSKGSCQPSGYVSLGGGHYTLKSSPPSTLRVNECFPWFMDGQCPTPPSCVVGEVEAATSCPSPELPPTVATTPATLVAQATATLNLAVNPSGSSTSAWFRYGTSSLDLDESTDLFEAGSGSTAISHSRPLSGLQCDRTYYFQAWADGYGEPVPGNILSFRTSDCSGGGDGGGGNGSEELIRNGDFSDDDAFWIASPDFYASDEFGNHHNGPGYAYLSEEDGDPGDGLNGTIYQQVAIPSNATSATLSYWISITTSEPSGASARDFLNATLQDEDGDHSALLELLSNQNHLTGYFKRQFNLENFIGQTIRLHFLGTTNATNPTVFRIDDVSLVAELPDGSEPAVTTLHEDQVESHSARLNMRVNPNGLPTEAWFKWDDDTNLSFETDRVSVGSGTSEVNAHIILDGLDCDKVYYFEAFAENSEGQDDGVRESLRTDECAIFDLVAFAPGVDDPTPSPGGTINFIFSTTNTGNDPAPANVPVTYYFDGAVVATGEEENPLLPGEVGRENETYAVPNQEGTYQAWACLDSYPEEPNASNNCTAPVDVNVIANQPEEADLIVVETTTTSGAEVMVGEIFDMTALVRNIGNQRSGLIILRFVADPTGVLDEHDLQIGSDADNPISADRERLLSDTVTAPAEPGLYLVGACVKRVDPEVNDSNNCSPDPFWLTVIAPPNQAPSIIIAQPDGVGDSTNVEYSIEWSASDPDDDAEIKLFYSRDSSCSSPVPISQPLVESDGLGSFYWYTKGLPTGDYYVLATIQDGEAEISTCSSGPVTIENNPAAFFSDSFETGSLSRWPGVVPESQAGLSVAPDAAWIGDYGLRIDLSPCPHEEVLVIPDQTIFSTETFIGCNEVQANDVDVETGASVILTSGSRVKLGDGFSVAAGGSLVVGIDPSLGGARYLRDHSPGGTSSYSAEFAIDTSELSFGLNGEFDVLVGYNPEGKPVLRLALSYDATQSAVIATSYALRSDEETWTSLVRTLGSEDKYLEVEWRSQLPASSGGLALCSRTASGVRGCGFDEHDLVDVIDSIRFGAVDRQGAVSGTLLIDQFISSEAVW